MFYQNMITLPLYNKSVSLSDYKQEIPTYTKVTDIDIVIGLNMYSDYMPDGINVIKSKYCGFTYYQGIEQGMKVGNYIVEYVINKRIGSYLYLSEVTKDAR